MKNTFITLTLSLCTSMMCFGQNFGKIDSTTAKLLENYNLKGIGIVAVQGNEIIYQRTFGYANMTNFFTDSTVIYIASNTKAFIGLSLSKLAFEKKINYSEPITKYISSAYFPAQIEAEKITIRNLIQHTHGLSNDPMVFRTAYSGEFPSNLKELLKFTVYRQDTLSYDFKYSNLGYLLGGIIIEEVTGKNWKDYVDEHIFNPIGMLETSSYINFKQYLEAMPFEYYSEEPISSRKSENTLHSAGGIYTTLSDMAKWLRIFTDDKQKVFSSILMKEYLDSQTVVGKRMGPFTMDGYGNGWINGTLMGEKLFYHFGSFPGYESIMSFSYEKETGVFIFVNERVGGQRIAAMLTAYFYMITNEDSAADEKIKMFSKFIDPIYSKTKPERTIFEYQNADELTGTYFSPEYGHLIIDKTSNGFTFSLGRLTSLAYLDAENNGIIIEWTPGITEHFTISKDNNAVKLIYSEFGEFLKQ
jgi:CubicO group peptidase (beta-lactamase class C family)